MTHTESHARTRATVRSHSLGRTLLVALLVSLAPLVAMVAVSAGGVTLAFLAGAATGTVVAVGRRRVARRVRKSAVRATRIST